MMPIPPPMPIPASVPREAVSGLVLAGGMGRRMGGVDKGLQRLQGRPMVQHVIERLAPQVDEVLLNANRNTDVYARFAYPVVPDQWSDFPGPLAGVHAGLQVSAHPLLVTVPCDSPFLPADLVFRLWTALTVQGAEIAVATTDGRLHPVFCLCRRSVLPNLEDFLKGGGRAFHRWYGTLNRVDVPFDDVAAAFENINTPAELAGFEAALNPSVE